MLSPFGKFLETCARRAGVSKRELAQIAEYKSASTLTDSLKADGPYLPALKALDQWSERLGLSKEDGQRLKHLAQLEHTPSEIRKYIRSLERENARLKKLSSKIPPRA